MFAKRIHKVKSSGVDKKNAKPRIFFKRKRKGVNSPSKNSRFFPKLSIGNTNDKYEQEADRVADKVIAMPENGIARRGEEIQANHNRNTELPDKSGRRTGRNLTLRSKAS